MKVALTTWFHYENYGTALQAVALSEKVKTLGHKVDVVNYIPHGTRYTNSKPSYFSESERVDDLIRSDRYREFIKKRLTFTKACVDEEDFRFVSRNYDAFISGSDQVWSPIVFDPRYYLDYVSDNRKKIAYASSFGVIEVGVDAIKERIKCLVSQFSHLSVREKSGAELIERLTGRTAQQVLDPTLLLDYDEWRNIIPKTKCSKKKYILCYFLGDNENQWSHAIEISKQKNIPLKIIPVFQKDSERGEIEYGVGPTEMFNLIDSAEMVLTDSYHGALVSIICQKPFYVFERFRVGDPVSQNSRIYNLLKLTKIRQNLIKYDDLVRVRYNEKFDYDDIISRVKLSRELSLKYLKESLVINSPKVSIIVPVRNVEKYIKKCLDSLVSQSYSNIEIIIVDDGTPDLSGKIADKYAKSDKRLRVIHKSYSGVSAARNAGLDIATGEYVVFVDADDIVAPNFVEYMLGLVGNRDSNIGALLNFYNEYSEDQNITPLSDFIEIYEPEVAIEGIYAWFFPLVCWNKIYKRSFLEDNKLRFIENLVYAEGMTFNIMALQNSGPVAVSRRQLYYQTFNPESVTHTTNINGWETCFKAYKYQKRNSKIWNDRIDRAHAFHAWLCNSSISRQIYRNGESKKYYKYLIKYKTKMIANLLSVLRANISKDQKKEYIHMAFHTKKDLLKINRQEKARLRDKHSLATKILPWEQKVSEPEPIIIDPEPTEIDLLKSDVNKLTQELNSMLSVKRSARLLLGNIKRSMKRRINW